MTFEEMMNAFMDHLRSLRRVKATQANYSIVARDFIRHCRDVQGCATPHEVRELYLGTYRKELEQRKFSRLTIYSRHRAVRTWFAWAHLRGHLLTDPMKNAHMQHPPLLPRGAPTEEQVEIFLAAPGPYLWGRRDRCLLEFLYCTGVRVGECVGLDLADVDLDQCLLRVYNGKTQKSRMVPFGERVQQLLTDYIDNIRPDFLIKPGNEQALWLGKRGRRCNTLNVQFAMRTYSKQVGFSITPHTLRHAYATHLMLRGASVVAVQALLGHERLGTTQRYTHLVPTDLKRELLATHPRGIRKQPRKKRK
ncbi:MAG: tyrosine-type recombinase/integrase [Vulcanimicrobiota bacterium]